MESNLVMNIGTVKYGQNDSNHSTFTDMIISLRHKSKFKIKIEHPVLFEYISVTNELHILYIYLVSTPQKTTTTPPKQGRQVTLGKRCGIQSFLIYLLLLHYQHIYNKQYLYTN